MKNGSCVLSLIYVETASHHIGGSLAFYSNTIGTISSKWKGRTLLGLTTFNRKKVSYTINIPLYWRGSIWIRNSQYLLIPLCRHREESILLFFNGRLSFIFLWVCLVFVLFAPVIDSVYNFCSFSHAFMLYVTITGDILGVTETAHYIQTSSKALAGEIKHIRVK